MRLLLYQLRLVRIKRSMSPRLTSACFILSFLQQLFSQLSSIMVQLAFISVCITLLAAFASAIPMERRIDQTIADSTACTKADGGAQCNTMTIPQNGALTNLVSSPGTPFITSSNATTAIHGDQNVRRDDGFYPARFL
ncbi:hypothetical protein BJV74DRAFT_290191 [Russula compacta]|nr:hypothetical protein BJV74DRAFT_290191 [Russula compacta]